MSGDARECAWCGSPLRPERIRRRIYCSTYCREQHQLHGARASLAQIEARLAHAEAQPKGHETIDAFIAAGGSVYREP